MRSRAASLEVARLRSSAACVHRPAELGRLLELLRDGHGDPVLVGAQVAGDLVRAGDWDGADLLLAGLPDGPASGVGGAAALSVLAWAGLCRPLDRPALVARCARYAEAADRLRPATPRHRFVLGLARLRTRRPQEVEALCADQLAARLRDPERASVLATVAMGRLALATDARTPLAEALALDRDAPLVGEAELRVRGDLPRLRALRPRPRPGPVIPVAVTTRPYGKPVGP